MRRVLASARAEQVRGSLGGESGEDLLKRGDSVGGDRYGTPPVVVMRGRSVMRAASPGGAVHAVVSRARILRAYLNLGWTAPKVFDGTSSKVVAKGFTAPLSTKFADIDGDGLDEIVSISGGRQGPGRYCILLSRLRVMRVRSSIVLAARLAMPRFMLNQMFSVGFNSGAEPTNTWHP